MPEWFESGSSGRIERFSSPGSVVLRASGDTLVDAQHTELFLKLSERGSLEEVTMTAEFDRSQLYRLTRSDPRLKLSRQDLIQIPPNVPVTVSFVAEPSLLNQLQSHLADGATPEQCATTVGSDGFPMCFNLELYGVTRVTVPEATQV